MLWMLVGWKGKTTATEPIMMESDCRLFERLETVGSHAVIWTLLIIKVLHWPFHFILHVLTCVTLRLIGKVLI